MPRSSQVPPFTQGLRKQGEGAARSQGPLSPITPPPHWLLGCTVMSPCAALPIPPPTTPAWASHEGRVFCL